MLMIRPAEERDSGPIWSILEPVIRAGETYTLPRRPQQRGRDCILVF